MKRSGHEELILRHLCALHVADQGKTRDFVDVIADLFDIEPIIALGNPPDWRSPDSMWAPFDVQPEPTRFAKRPLTNHKNRRA